MGIPKGLRASCEQGQAGSYNAEGLPNISGSFTCQKCGVNDHVTVTGPFSSTSAPYIGSGNGSSGSNIQWNFNASKANSIYGSSNSVMPESVDVLCIIYLGK